MRIIAIKTLREFYEKHPETKTGIEVWQKKTKAAKWEKPNDILDTFSKARPITNNRVIFGINKNYYRLIVEINYDRQSVFIRFIGKHIKNMKK